LVALGTLPPAFMADGAGIYNLFRQLGGSFGIAFIVTMIDQREHFHFQRIGEHLNAYQGNVQQFILQMQYALHLPLMPPQQTPIVPPSQHTPYELLRGLLMQQATILTYKDVFYFLLVMSIFSFMLLFFMKKDRGAKKPSVAVH